MQACQVSRIVRVTHAIGSFHTLTRKPGLLSRIFVHAWNRDMASSFTSIRDRRIKITICCIMVHQPLAEGPLL